MCSCSPYCPEVALKGVCPQPGVLASGGLTPFAAFHMRQTLAYHLFLYVCELEMVFTFFNGQKTTKEGYFVTCER